MRLQLAPVRVGMFVALRDRTEDASAESVKQPALLKFASIPGATFLSLQMDAAEGFCDSGPSRRDEGASALTDERADPSCPGLCN